MCFTRLGNKCHRLTACDFFYARKDDMSDITYETNLISFPKTLAVQTLGFGRKVIKTDEGFIDATNVVQELNKALAIHNLNVLAINYLDRYYRGDQPILYRVKKTRPEINNLIVENHALEIVDSKVADLFGEPIQYVIADNEDVNKAEAIAKLNKYMKSEEKAALDIERATWASICGTSYYYVGNENRLPKIFDEAPYYLKVESPIQTFVCYYADDDTPAFSCQIRKGDEGNIYNVYTPFTMYIIQGGEIIEEAPNGNDMIPVIEYPNNARRLSDIEVTITITDALNKLQSDRINAIEQFVQAFILFKNCKIDEETFKKLAFAGALSIKDSMEGKVADAKMMTSELSQDGTQISKEDLYNSLLVIQGMPSREEASGSDTGQAAALRNGYYAEEKRAELRIPLFQRSERLMLRVVINKLRKALGGFMLDISDIDIRPSRSKLDNMMVKAQVLQILHQVGVDDAIALKTINLFSDVQDVISKSSERMEQQFEHSIGNNETEPIVEVNEDGNTIV